MTDERRAEEITMPEPMDDDTFADVFKHMLERRYFDMFMCPQSDITTVFLPLALGGLRGYTSDQLRELVVYEYMEKAGDRSINGMPIFMSCRLMLRSDRLRLQEALIKMEAALMKIVEDSKIGNKEGGA